MIVKDKDGNDIEINDEVAAQIKAEAEKSVREEVGGELAALKDANSGLVDQVKDLRKKREPQEPADATKAPTDITSEVERILAERREEEAAANKLKAIELFKAKNKVFHPENDPGGLKFRVVESELAILNLQGLHSVEDFLGRIEKAKQLAMPETTKEEEVPLDPSAPSSAGGGPRAVEQSKLTPLEQKAAKKAGWTEERFLKLKEAQPEYVKEVLHDLSKYLD